MKGITNIRFENEFDEESIKMYKTLSEDKVNELIQSWKVEIEKTMRNEMSDENITTFKIGIEIINE